MTYPTRHRSASDTTSFTDQRDTGASAKNHSSASGKVEVVQPDPIRRALVGAKTASRSAPTSPEKARKRASMRERCPDPRAQHAGQRALLAEPESFFAEPTRYKRARTEKENKNEQNFNGSSRSAEMARAIFPAKDGLNFTHVKALRDCGVKFSLEQLVATTASPQNEVLFLEAGTGSRPKVHGTGRASVRTSGLAHILDRHGSEFAQAGVPVDQVAKLVLEAVARGDTKNQRPGTRPIFVIPAGDRFLRIAVTVGSNGYVVGAHFAGYADAGRDRPHARHDTPAREMQPMHEE